MTEENRETARIQIVETVRLLEEPSSPWVNLSDLGSTLRGYGVSYREYGFEKLRPFLESFENLEFKMMEEDDKPPVYYVRLKEEHRPQTNVSDLTEPKDRGERVIKKFAADMKFSDWAFIFNGKYDNLVEMMPEEDWGRIEKEKVTDETGEIRYPRYPKLENYIINTAKRLAYENKILYATNPAEKLKYAAFNTGLVDKSYDWIYALFKENTRFPDKSPWYLVDFVIVGQNAGKTLNSIFPELPQRANYFDSIGNVLFDTSKRIECDYEHMLIEHVDRLPMAFIRTLCPEFSCINGVSIEDIYDKKWTEEKRREYYDNLSNKLRESPLIYNRLKKAFEDSLGMAIKRVEWNYKTAVPMYYPTKNIGALLLPLSLVTPDRVDVALVVTQEPSGAYQGQTILTLSMAYSNSRLVARPDSDWLIDLPTTNE